MSHHEYEAYLALLARFLRLSPRQREDIRRELRAHMEEAIEEQTARGVPRDVAIRRALEDFGDAAELAGRFSNIGRRRRWIMKGTAAAACVGLAAFVFNGSTGRLVWDTPQMAAPAETASAAGVSRYQSGGAAPSTASDRGADERIRSALSRRVEEVTFESTPLGEVIHYLTELMGVNVHVQWARLEDYGAGDETPISLKLRDVTVERALRLILNEIREVPVAYEIEDGVLLISTREGMLRNLSTGVYDVRDLLGEPYASASLGAAVGFPSVADGPWAATISYPGDSREVREQSATAPEVREALDQIVPEVALEDQTFESTIDWLVGVSNLNVVVDWECLSNDGVQRDRPISLSLKRLPFRIVLSEVLRKAGGTEIDLAYAVEDGLIRIATRERLLQTRAIADAGLGTSGRDAPEGEFDAAADELVAMIQRSVGPWSWESNGVENGGHLEVYRGLLVVRTAAPIHDKLARLLNDMRTAARR